MSFHLPDSDTDPFLTFSSLGGVNRLSTVYVIGWRFLDEGDEAWTRRFYSAKFGGESDRQAAAKLLRHVFARRLCAGGTLVVPAISHDRRRADPGSLPYSLASAISVRGAVFAPHLLTHEPRERLTSRSASERDSILKDAYGITGVAAARIADKRIIVVDDLVTRGGTLRAIAGALSSSGHGPTEVIGVCLAKNERKSYAQSMNYDLDNGHIPEMYAQVWANGKRL